MQQEKSLTLDGLVLKNFGLLILSLGMIFVGIYLTNHFFDTFYPSGISNSSSLCELGDFWGCDKATRSPLGKILGMPTSVFGIIMGVFGLLTAVLGKREIEKTAKLIFTLNFAVCVILFIYSLIALGGLCPLCTVYYFLSAGIFFLFFKFSHIGLGVDPKFGGLFLALLILPIAGLNAYIGGKEEKISKLAVSYIEQFNNLKEYGDPQMESPYKIHMQTKTFAEAPIRITVFSDFQCPYCQEVSKQMPTLIDEFKDKIAIQYMFYPLDSSCNPKMKGSMHPFACQAAYLAACDTEKFAKIHDTIFEHQAELSYEKLKQWKKEFNLDPNCTEDMSIKEEIAKTLKAGDQYNLQSTPTIIINGRKLEGLIPTVHLVSILKSLVK